MAWFDEVILKATVKSIYWAAIVIFWGLWLVVLVAIIFGVCRCLEPRLSNCWKELQRRTQEDQGNELNTLPTSSRRASGAPPPSNAAEESSSTLVPFAKSQPCGSTQSRRGSA